jgi:polysaccharide biosynthesis transport protein
MSAIAPYDAERITRDSSGIIVLSDAIPLVSEGIGLAECWRVIRRSLRLICALLITFLLITGLVVFLKTPNFTASSTLLIEPQPPQVLDVRELISEAGGTEDHDYYKTQYDLLRSQDLAARVIRDLNLEHYQLFSDTEKHEYRTRLCTYLGSVFMFLFVGVPHPAVSNDSLDGVSANAINAYLSRLTVEPKIGTRLVVVSFSAPDPMLAARIVDAHVHQYVHQSLELRSESRRATVEFLTSELVEIKQRVQQSEAALNRYRRQKGIVSFDVEDANKVAEGRMEDLTRALTEAETRRVTAEAQMRQVRAGDYDSLPQIVSNPTITALKPEVRHLQAEYAYMSTAFNDNYPKLAELKVELRESKRSLDREMRAVAKAVKRSYKAAADEEKNLRAEIEAEKDQDLTLNGASLQDAVLAREVETDRELYKNVLLRMQQIQVGELAPVTNISIVDRAVPPSFPSTPKKTRDLAIGGLLALLCGIALAFIRDRCDTRFKTGEEIEQYLHLPNLAVAPDFAMLNELTGNHKSLFGTLRQALLGYRSTIGDSFRTYVHQPGKAEVYRSIRTALVFSRAGSPPAKVLVTSAIEGEGKTWTAIHTALAFAQTGRRTLLIDADLRRARCHEILGTPRSIGLSEILTGHLEPEEAIYFLGDGKPFLLPAGSSVVNPAELLTSIRMRQLLQSLSRVYEHILIDTAPLMYASDTAGIATMADGIVLVAGANTSRACVRRAADRLSFAGANVLGVVLNRVDIHHPDHREYSRYYFSYDEVREVSAVEYLEQQKQ